MFKSISLLLLVSLALFMASCKTDNKTDQQTNATADDKANATTYVTMPESTAIAVILVDSIDTDIHVSGDEFRARLSRPIVVDGHTLFESGAPVVGILDKVVESGRLKTPAELNFSLTAIQDENGNWIDVGTDMILNKKGSHTNREVAMIGGGAIVGGIIGKIIDRKGSTEIGAAAGAAAGAGMSAATGKDDIFYGAGSEIVFFSSQSTRIAVR
ncbi:MAG: hypothetical protein CVT49_12970 [candidate division Zixibacteria bacterium HGW-Zixibacteria-1]|nr:MAG: hypothetical protein CVT49_12970 [candidate division Zixibacteria bacterium HGW-Zixibacteria-1]